MRRDLSDSVVCESRSPFLEYERDPVGAGIRSLRRVKEPSVDAAADEEPALVAGVEGEEVAPQVLRASAVAVANRIVGRALMDMWHLLSVIGGCRTLQDSCELTDLFTSKK